MKYIMQFNGKSSSDLGIVLYDCAKISGGKKHYDNVVVAGRLGELVGNDKYQSNITIKCYMALLDGKTPQRVRQVKDWLKGNGVLRFSDSPETFYRVLKIEYGDIERNLIYYGKFEVSFLCVPYEFRNDGNTEYPIEQIKRNPYSLARPIYKITGNGKCTLTVNGKSMSANVNGNLTIDTNLMIAYQGEVLKNTAVSGDYTDIYLPSGKLSIDITQGFDLSIIPNWGYDV